MHQQQQPQQEAVDMKSWRRRLPREAQDAITKYSDASGKTTMPRPSCCYDYTCADNSHYNAYTCCKPPTYRYPVRDGNANAASLEHRCPYYQQTATLSFQFTEDVIKGFFHNQSDYGKIPLLVYFLCTFFVACITYGIAVPSGLFVPCILMGSAFGRLWGEYMRDWFGPSIRPDVYALIGAAAMLSSVTRITITITVILFETTGQLFMIMPIMGTVLLSKWIADHFNISLYDMHVELKCVPFVEPDPPKVMVGMLAGEVMTTPCVAMHEVESVATVIELLKTAGRPTTLRFEPGNLPPPPSKPEPTGLAAAKAAGGPGGCGLGGTAMAAISAALAAVASASAA